MALNPSVSASANQDHPFFSVIIPTYNRPQNLRKCLEAFLDLTYPAHGWELIVVNDGGQHSFAGLADDLQEKLPLRLMTIEHGGPAKARNYGASQAKGEYLAFTDDDCQVEPHWLHAFAEGFLNGDWAALGGEILNPFPESVAAETWSQYMVLVRDGLMRTQADELLLILSNNAAYRAEIFNRLGGFNEIFPIAAAEDTELGFRLVGHGYQQKFHPDARVWHYHPTTAYGYLRQQFRYGRGNYYFEQIQKMPSYPMPVRKIDGLIPFFRELFRFSRSIKAPWLMVLLFIATPFIFAIGNRLERMRHQFNRWRTSFSRH